VSDEELSPRPQTVPRRKDVWWYEAPSGLQFVVEQGCDCSPSSIQFTVPWSHVEQALLRKRVKLKRDP
jgi:hypothetical protein